MRQSSELSQSVSSCSRFFVRIHHIVGPDIIGRAEVWPGKWAEIRYQPATVYLCDTVHLSLGERTDQTQTLSRAVVCAHVLSCDWGLSQSRAPWLSDVGNGSMETNYSFVFCPRDVLLLWVINIAHKLVNTDDMKNARNPVTALPLCRSSAPSFVGTGRPDKDAVTLTFVVRSHSVAAAQDLWTGIYFLPSLQLVALA